MWFTKTEQASSDEDAKHTANGSLNPGNGLPRTSGNGSLNAGLVFMLPLVPMGAAVLAAMTYDANENQTLVILVGIGGSLVLWLFAGLFARASTTAERHFPWSYGHIRARLVLIDAQLGITRHDAHADLALPLAGAQRETLECRNEIVRQCMIEDERWVQCEGYVVIWRLVHRAEEALIEWMPPDNIIGGALTDERSLQGSKIENAGVLLEKLHAAVSLLDPAATRYFSKDPCSPLLADRSAGLTPASAPSGAPDDDNIRQARAILRHVRSIINKFRDHQWSGIVKAGAQLRDTIFACGLFTAVLVLLSVIVGVDQSVFRVVTGLYLIGAVVGLINRLYAESKLDAGVDDYGLSAWRMLATILLSGLAAVGGVLIAIMLYTTVLVQRPGTALPPSVSINDIFNLTKYPLDVIIAAVFGLAPNLLITSLQRQAAKYSGDINSSKPA